MIVRIRVIGRSRLLRVAIYEAEARYPGGNSWRCLGRKRAPRLMRILDESGVHPSDVTEVMNWAIDAYEAHDDRWVYPEWGPLDSSPGSD